MSEAGWLSVDPAMRMAVRGALSLLFLGAAAHKLRDAGAFRAAVVEYRIVPQSLLAVTVVSLIAAELLVGVGLVVTSGWVVVAAAAGLLSLYAVAIAINLARGRRIDCGCFGPAARRPLGGALVVRNLALLLLGLVGALPPAPRPLFWVDAVTIAGFIGALSILYLACDTLIANAAVLGTTGERQRENGRTEHRLATAPAPRAGG